MKNKMKTEDNKFEEDILGSFKKGEWRSVPDLKDEIERYASSAAATLTPEQELKIARNRLKEVQNG